MFVQIAGSTGTAGSGVITFGELSGCRARPAFKGVTGGRYHGVKVSDHRKSINQLNHSSDNYDNYDNKENNDYKNP